MRCFSACTFSAWGWHGFPFCFELRVRSSIKGVGCVLSSREGYPTGSLEKEEACEMDISSGGIILSNDISYFTGSVPYSFLAFLYISSAGVGADVRIGYMRVEQKIRKDSLILQPPSYILTFVSYRCV